jgi:putative addiction module component (TIGR02574 family)
MRYPTRGELCELSPIERLRLIEDVWETFVGDPESLPLSEEDEQIIDARLAAWRSDPNVGSSWDEVRRRIIARYLRSPRILGLSHFCKSRIWS